MILQQTIDITDAVVVTLCRGREKQFQGPSL